MLNSIWKKNVIGNYKKLKCVKTVCTFIIARRIIRQLVKMIIWLSSYYHVIILILCFKKYLVSLIDRQKRIPLVCSIRFQISWNWYFIRTIYNKSGHMMIAHYLFKILSLLVDNLTFPIYKLLNITYQHKFTPKGIEIYN